MIILKGKVSHTTHSYTKHSQKKKWKRKTAKKAKCTSIKQQQAKAWTKLSDNLYSVPSTEEAHELNRRFWDSKYRKMYLLQGLQGKQRLWRHRWVVAILLYSGRSRPSDTRGAVSRPWHKGGGGGGLVSQKKWAVHHSPTPVSQNVIYLIRWPKQTSLRSWQCP